MKRSRRNHSPAFKALPAEELGMRLLAAHCHLGLGQLETVLADITPARDHIKQALMPYREMGMQYWVEKAESAVRALQPTATTEFVRERPLVLVCNVRSRKARITAWGRPLPFIIRLRAAKNCRRTKLLRPAVQLDGWPEAAGQLGIQHCSSLAKAAQRSDGACKYNV